MNCDPVIGRACEEFRLMLTTANHLEALQSNLESVIDFFLPPADRLHEKLCNTCMRLFFETDFKLETFRRAEELVWKRIYHDLYRLHKSKVRSQQLTKEDLNLVQAHFISGIGFYSSLIVSLRLHFKIDSGQNIIAPLSLSLKPIDSLIESRNRESQSNELTSSEENSLSVSFNAQDTVLTLAQSWARLAIYRCLVYMGDLARYLFEISKHNYRKLAFDFYQSATRFQIDHGLPYNQLATLSGGFNYNLGAVCNYMRCCLKPKPFGAAESNMRNIFDLNRKLHEDLSNNLKNCTISDILASKDPSHSAELLVQNIIVLFIKLTSDLWNFISTVLDKSLRNLIVEETKFFFESLREALELDPIVPFVTSSDTPQPFNPVSGASNPSEKPKYITPTIMFEFCSISLMLIEKCQKQSDLHILGVTNTYAIDLVNTLALNLLHYSTAKCHKIVMSKVLEMKVSRHESFSNGSANCAINSTNSSSQDLCSRRAQSRLRQKETVTNYSCQNRKPSTCPSLDPDMSDLEETALSTIDALEISSDMSEELEDHKSDLIDLNSTGDDISIPKSTDESISELDSTLIFLYNQTHLPSIKVFCDWLISNGQIISSNLVSFQMFCNDFNELVTLVKDVFRLASTDLELDLDNQVQNHFYNGPDWIQKYPLSCDISLAHLSILKNVHSLNIDFNYPMDELQISDEGFITFQCIVAFSHALTAFFSLNRQ